MSSGIAAGRTLCSRSILGAARDAINLSFIDGSHRLPFFFGPLRCATNTAAFGSMSDGAAEGVRRPPKERWVLLLGCGPDFGAC